MQRLVTLLCFVAGFRLFALTTPTVPHRLQGVYLFAAGALTGKNVLAPSASWKLLKSQTEPHNLYVAITTDTELPSKSLDFPPNRFIPADWLSPYHDPGPIAGCAVTLAILGGFLSLNFALAVPAPMLEGQFIEAGVNLASASAVARLLYRWRLSFTEGMLKLTHPTTPDAAHILSRVQQRATIEVGPSYDALIIFTLSGEVNEPTEALTLLSQHFIDPDYGLSPL